MLSHVWIPKAEIIPNSFLKSAPVIYAALSEFTPSPHSRKDNRERSKMFSQDMSHAAYAFQIVKKKTLKKKELFLIKTSNIREKLCHK